MTHCRFAIALLLLPALSAAGEFPVPRLDMQAWRSPLYPCNFSEAPPCMDGHLDDPAWATAPWTDDFVDIQGDLRATPRHRTRVKMLWDDQFFYIAAELEEPQLWAEITRRDAVIYHENDFEVFLDPDGDTHDYYELEINALGTVWDLLLTRPYRDGGRAVDAWDLRGLRKGVALDGTLNDPTDVDRGWTLELAMPWSVLEECAQHPGPPRAFEKWRINFSRVQWQLDVTENRYTKKLASDGKPLPEDNWVWSAQGLVAMHYPEMWGVVRFLPARSEIAVDGGEARLSPLRQLYYAEKRFHAAHGYYTAHPEELLPLPGGIQDWPAALVDYTLSARTRTFLATGPPYGYCAIDETGRFDCQPMNKCLY